MAPPGYKKPPETTKRCANPNCNIEFITSRPNKKYHSQVCGMNHWMSLHPRRKAEKIEKAEKDKKNEPS